MDNEAPVKPTETKPGMSPIANTPAKTMAAARLPQAATLETMDGSDRNGIFRHLVKDDGDIEGLVAYSIYKQNKLDWLAAFQAAKMREPNDAELASYIIGEGTPRRLATYRHLAEATLAGRGPDVEGSSASTKPAHRRTGAASTSAFSPAIIGAYVLIAILFVVGLWFAAHFTVASR